MIDALTPFGVGKEYSWITSGLAAGQILVRGKLERSAMV
jgi:hypothetical protein